MTDTAKLYMYHEQTKAASKKNVLARCFRDMTEMQDKQPDCNTPSTQQQNRQAFT